MRGAVRSRHISENISVKIVAGPFGSSFRKRPGSDSSINGSGNSSCNPNSSYIALARIVGSSYNCFTTSTAFVYDADERRLRWIDPQYGSSCRSSGATAVNDRGDVVGWARTGGIPDMKPFIWNDSDGYRVLPGSAARNRDNIWPTDINNANQVVGRFDTSSSRTSLFYWDEENRFHDLTTLLDPSDPMTDKVILYGETIAFDPIFVPKINDRGQILVTGSLRGEPLWRGPKHTFLLVPVQEK